MWSKASLFSASSDKVVVMGGSAGANLACAVVISVVEKEPILKPKGLIMACSCTIHPSVIPEEYNKKEFWDPERLADSALLDRESMMTCMGECFHSTLPIRS
jgi:acetyl esterase/lipase